MEQIGEGIALIIDSQQSEILSEEEYSTHDLEIREIVFSSRFGNTAGCIKHTMFTNHKRLQHILDQRELNMRLRRLLRLLSDFDGKIRYHPGKASVTADALIINEQAKPLRVKSRKGLKVLMYDKEDENGNRRTFTLEGSNGLILFPYVDKHIKSINEVDLSVAKGHSNYGCTLDEIETLQFPVVIFNDDDIEERTSRWVNECVKKFNPYARYGVEHWKNPHAKIFYIRKQKEPGRPKEEIYSNSKIVQPDYKNLNKNDMEDIYLLIMNGKVPDYADTGLLWSLSVFIRSSVIWERVHDFQLGNESYQQKVNLTAPTMTFPGIEEYEVFSIVYDLVHGIIYKNSKKEKRVMRHSEIHKFCDATLMRVLEGLKSYNNDVKYGYVQKELTSDEVEYLKLFEEEIEVRMKYRNQMRR
ncbi:hypothetical protein Tco_0250575 [Tanacetum coccineum]